MTRSYGKRSTIICMNSLGLIKEQIPDIIIDLRYSSSQNITGQELYAVERAYLNNDAILALKKVQRVLNQQGLGLKIWDAYRPLSVSRTLWESTPPSKRLYVADPALGSNHNRGCAVDLTLYNLSSHTEVNMPSDFDDFAERAWPSYKDTSSKKLEMRDLLRSLMEDNGFSVNPYEWWHFDWNEWESYPVLDTPIEAL